MELGINRCFRKPSGLLDDMGKNVVAHRGKVASLIGFEELARYGWLIGIWLCAGIGVMMPPQDPSCIPVHDRCTETLRGIIFNPIIGIITRDTRKVADHDIPIGCQILERLRKQILCLG